MSGVNYEGMMERYLLGHDQELDAALSDDYFQNAYFHLFALDLRKENTHGKDLSDILYKKLIREVECIEEMQTMVVVLREMSVCVIFCHAFHQNKKMKKVAEMLSEKLSAMCGDILGVLSREFHRIEEIKEVYQRDIAPNIEKKFYYPDVTMILAEENSARKQSVKVEKFDFFKYSMLLENRNYQEAIQMLHTYNHTALEAQSDEYRLKNQIKNMVYCFLDGLVISEEQKELYQYEFFKQINQTVSIYQYEACMNKIEEKLLELSGAGMNQNDDRIYKILTYIENNYKEDLKLEKVADQFNFNYSYLSAYFNQQAKESFNDYLNRIRITKSCQLLKESRHSIAQISQEVGYSEHSYFCRVFRKITGKTPSEWRRS